MISSEMKDYPVCLYTEKAASSVSPTAKNKVQYKPQIL